MSQWETYVARDTTLRALFIKRKLDATAETFMAQLDAVDAVFVSATMWPILRQTHTIRAIVWNRLFIDEADSISLSNDWDELHARFYWFISASWLNLVFASGAYFNIAASYMPPPETPVTVVERVQKLMSGTGNYLNIPGCRHMNIVRRICDASTHSSVISLNAAGSQSARLVVHSNESFIRDSFTIPAVSHTNIICSTPATIRVLDSFISPDMLERLHAGDLTGALETIGMTATSETDITDAVTQSLQKEVEQARRTYEFKKTIEYSSDAAKAKALELCEQKIASLASRITAIQERLANSKEQTCPICFCGVSSPSVVPCCQQLFCFPCLCESLKRVASCPLCRARIDDIKSVRVVGDTHAIVPTSDPSSKVTKKESFFRFLRANTGAKVLMFSGYDASFTGLEQKLKDEAIPFANLNGSQARINKLLREFEAGKYTTLFLNARNMGAGLNIEAASHVVLFHKMSAELEEQIVGRALRLGRSKPLEVVHLYHENEVRDTVMHV
jgi:rubrerythrin